MRLVCSGLQVGVNMANTIEPSVYSGDAALYHIALTTGSQSIFLTSMHRHSRPFSTRRDFILFHRCHRVCLSAAIITLSCASSDRLQCSGKILAHTSSWSFSRHTSDRYIATSGWSHVLLLLMLACALSVTLITLPVNS